MRSLEERPVLVTSDDLVDMSDDARLRHNFPVSEVRDLLKSKLDEGENAAVQAAGLLLTHAAVAIIHVDITKTRASYSPHEDRIFYENGTSVGFNDHFGGSESAFKIMLNGSPSGNLSSYILYSPPDESGRPANTTFRNCDFTFLSWESKGRYRYNGPGHVPNTLKTRGAAQYRGASDYRYFLFGGPEAPNLVYEQFANAGFTFADTPYSDELDSEEPDNAWVLRRHERNARRALGYRGGHYWPGDQFSEQLGRIGLETPKLSIADYPLVRPENQES